MRLLHTLGQDCCDFIEQTLENHVQPEPEPSKQQFLAISLCSSSSHSRTAWLWHFCSCPSSWRPLYNTLTASSLPTKQTQLLQALLPIVSCRSPCPLQGPFQFCAIPQTGHDSGVGPIMSHRRKSLPLICEIWYNTELKTTRNSRSVGISKSKAMSHSFFLQIQSIYGTVPWNMMTHRTVVIFTQKRWAQCWQYIFFSKTLENTQGGKCRIVQIHLWKCIPVPESKDTVMQLHSELNKAFWKNCPSKIILKNKLN